MEKQPNLNYIKDLSGDDYEFEQKFIAVLKEEIPLEKKEYQKCVTAENYKDTASIVHKLKHKLNILSLTEDYKIAVKYEEDLNKQDSSLHEDFLIILNKIEIYIKNL
jgi:HPt (histidine-containing phosphotransfer) domain-containing protein